MKPCAVCETPLPVTAKYCMECSAPVHPGAANHAQASGPGSFAVAGPGTQISVDQRGNGWDNRPQTQFHRTEGRVSGWLEFTAALITLGAAIVGVFAGWVQKFDTRESVILFAIAVAVVAVVGFFTVHFTVARISGRSVVRLGSWVLGVIVKETAPSRLVWTLPRATCMLCPAHKAGVMKLQVVNGNVLWVCSKNSTQHRVGFDWTQL